MATLAGTCASGVIKQGQDAAHQRPRQFQSQLALGAGQAQCKSTQAEAVCGRQARHEQRGFSGRAVHNSGQGSGQAGAGGGQRLPVSLCQSMAGNDDREERQAGILELRIGSYRDGQGGWHGLHQVERNLAVAPHTLAGASIAMGMLAELSAQRF